MWCSSRGKPWKDHAVEGRHVDVNTTAGVSIDFGWIGIGTEGARTATMAARAPRYLTVIRRG